MTRRFRDASVAAVFAAYPADVRARLMALRELIFATGAKTDGVGPVEEVLKWGQPSYLTPGTRSGTTIRLDAIASRPGDYALYVHCQTTLIGTFRERFGGLFRYEGNRALVFSVSDALPKKELRECLALALTYHSAKRPQRVPLGTLIR